jgi:hypothetical protein
LPLDSQDGAGLPEARVSCYLLHVVEEPDPAPYEDQDLKDVVGHLPKFYCTGCTPPRRVKPSEAVKCLDRAAPCWKPVDRAPG